MRGPTITTDLYAYRTDQLRGEVNEKVEAEARRLTGALSDYVTDQIRTAYSRGLQDGFAQGVYSAGPTTKEENHA